VTPGETQNLRCTVTETSLSDPVRMPVTVVAGADEKTWLRADAGGLLEMNYERGSLVYEGDVICTVSDPFRAESECVSAPFTGLLVGVAENPLVYPGNPLVHLVELDEPILRALEIENSAYAP
jgi:predicted deacylase